MNKDLNKIFLLTVFTITSLLYSKNDLEYWSNFEVSNTASEKLTFKIKPSIRFSDYLSKLYWADFTIGANYKINDGICFEAFYRQLIIKPSNSWSTEYRPYFDINLKKVYNKFYLQDRNLIEFLIKDIDSSYRYRNKLTIGRFELIRDLLYVSFADEIFYDIQNKTINLNRIYIDLKYRLTKNQTFGIGLIQQQKLQGDDWLYTNVIQSKIIYRM